MEEQVKKTIEVSDVAGMLHDQDRPAFVIKAGKTVRIDPDGFETVLEEGRHNYGNESVKFNFATLTYLSNIENEDWEEQLRIAEEAETIIDTIEKSVYSHKDIVFSQALSFMHLRIKANMTRAQLAKKAGVHTDAIKFFESYDETKAYLKRKHGFKELQLIDQVCPHLEDYETDEVKIVGEFKTVAEACGWSDEKAEEMAKRLDRAIEWREMTIQEAFELSDEDYQQIKDEVKRKIQAKEGAK